eukprot:CAMPEP_0113730168 /NCGR_PEP_ID=MMETSP0038_2-20120614/43007_1 /TAXON_ID=2898 /ORGANISM="Cryptomonas paramecium" /LENGTH=56 /DNA_ID=CAMNT_0000662195 /DNA_START=125 /DNA_END=295 /DNA_ORIENTATION=+ /assembly_acc=CAM_ASM_000170
MESWAEGPGEKVPQSSPAAGAPFPEKAEAAPRSAADLARPAQIVHPRVPAAGGAED